MLSSIFSLMLYNPADTFYLYSNEKDTILSSSITLDSNGNFLLVEVCKTTGYYLPKYEYATGNDIRYHDTILLNYADTLITDEPYQKYSIKTYPKELKEIPTNTWFHITQD